MRTQLHKESDHGKRTATQKQRSKETQEDTSTRSLTGAMGLKKGGWNIQPPFSRHNKRQ